MNQDYPEPNTAAPCSYIDWQRIRVEAAIAAMQGLCANPAFETASETQICELALNQAATLIAGLQKEVVK